MYKLAEFDQGQVLGSGMIGTTYEAVNKKNGKVNKEVVIKVERFLIQHQYWLLENLFAFEMGSLYPQHFTQLYDFVTTKKCDHIQQYNRNLKKFDKKLQKQFKDLAKSEWCIYRVYSRIDTTFKKISDEKLYTPTRILANYSMLAQMCYIIELMQNHGWSHGDLHYDNIGIKFTDEKTINLGDITIPTYGRRYYAIDYGTVEHKLLGIKSSPGRYYENDTLELLNWMGGHTEFWQHTKPIPFDKATKEFKKQKIVVDPPNDKLLHTVIFYTMPELFQKVVSPTTKEFYPVECEITKNDILFYAQNWSNPRTLKEYFANLCK